MSGSTELRVALFSGNYNYQTDGANKALNRLVGYLERQGVPVLVFSPTSDTPAFPPEGELVSVPSFPVPGRGEYRIGLPLNGALRARITAFAPTLIHLSAPDWLGHSALAFAERRGVPAVASFHTRFDTYFSYYGLPWVQSLIRRRMGRFYSRCEHVYVPTQSVGDVLVQDGIIGDNRRTWSRGVDRDLFTPAQRDLAWRRSVGLGDDEIVISFVGRLVKEKGPDELKRLTAELRKLGHRVRPLVVGDGPERARLEAAMPDAVFTGHLSGTDLARAYASSDIYFNPSLTETFGNVTLEAMASGVATVCVEATGSASLIQRGETGLLLDPLKKESWARDIAPLCGDRALRSRLAGAARERSGDYDWDLVLGEVLAQYHEVIRPEAAAPGQIAA